MSGTLQPPPLAAPTRVWPMYRALVGVGLFCGLLIVGVYQFTRPIIERKKAAALERAIFQVLPEARSSAIYRLDEDGSFSRVSGQPAAEDELVYAGYGESGDLVGLAIEARGMGYQDVIVLLYGYSFRDDAVIGVRVLESKETPGLGTRIESDPGFLQNFRRLDVKLGADGAALAHPVEGVKHGRKQHDWQIDGITGATISSMAVANMMRGSTAYWIPRVRRRLDDFRKAG